MNQQKTSVLSIEANIPQYELNIRQATNHICTLLGQPAFDLVQKIGTGPIPTASAEVAIGIPANLLERRPDVRSAERSAAAQCAQIGYAQADFYPHIFVNGAIGYQWTNTSVSNTVTPFNGSVGPSFQWNILNYGQIINNVRLQDATFRELLLVYRNTVLQAHEDVENELAAFLRYQEQTKILEESVASAREAMDFIVENVAKGRYALGGASATTVVQVETALATQELALAQARGNVATGLVGIYRALGGGWQLRCGKVECLPIEPNTPPAATPKPPEELLAPLPAPPQPTAKELPKAKEKSEP
jgi:outer membrane protein TolC